MCGFCDYIDDCLSGADQEWVVVGGRELFPGGADEDQHRVHDEFALDLANIVPGLGEVGIIGNHSMITSSSFYLLYHAISCYIMICPGRGACGSVRP